MLLRRVSLAFVAVVALALQAAAAVFVQPPTSGTAPSGLPWSAVATGTALPIRSSGTTSSATGLPGAVAYWNTQTGELQIDTKGWDLSLFNFTYTTGTVNTTGSSPGPLTYASGTSPTSNAVSGATGLANQRTVPAGSWTTLTVAPARVAGTVSLTGAPSLTTVYDSGNGAANGTSPYATQPNGNACIPGWFNQPWAFPLGMVNSGSVATMDTSFWRTFGVTGNANANLLGYGNYRSTFQYVVQGVVGNQVGAVIPVVPEPSTYAMLGSASIVIGMIARRRKTGTA